MVQKSNRKTKYTTPSEWSKNLTENQNIPYRRNGPKIYQKIKIYHTVGMVQRSNRRSKYITPSEWSKHLTEISYKDANPIPVRHKYTTSHFPVLVLA